MTTHHQPLSTVLAMSAAIMLTACGSSGSNTPSTQSTSSIPKPSTPRPPQSNTNPPQSPLPNTSTSPKPVTPAPKPTENTPPVIQPVAPITPKPLSKPAEATPKQTAVNGYYFTKPDTMNSEMILQGLQSNKVAKVVIDDVIFNVARGRDIPDTFTGLDQNGDDFISGKHVSHIKYGVLRHGVEQATIFMQGESTKEMPQSGIVDYQGRALVTYNRGISPDWQSNITANFGSKQLHGTLMNDVTHSQYDFNASIKGNQFEGDSSIGSFYGDNAAEVGGFVNVYDPIEGYGHAVFGAKRVK